ncbi:hypothetical protein OG21DRAFT_1491091 [Imleria badia]|nr:hypothetical protein OG21DRAFT_1491091 [Imleria badia]
MTMMMIYSSSTPAPQFNYDEPPSPASSAGPREVEVMPPCSPQLTGPLSLPESSSPTKPLDTLAPSKDSSVLERWLRTRSKKTNKNQSLQPPDGLSTTPSRPAKPRSRSKSPPRVNTANKRPSWFIPGQRVRVGVLFFARQMMYMSDKSSQRAVAKPVDWRKGNSKVAKPDHAKNDASRSGQRPTSAKEVDSAQKANDAAQPSAVAEVHVMPGTGDATVSIAFKFKLPAWVLCLRSSTDDGNH